MVYLKSFTLPTREAEESIVTPNEYPFGLFAFRDIEPLIFSPITILYGSNGSGKSTLLNLIGEKLHLARETQFNKSRLFDTYAHDFCDYSLAYDDDGVMMSIPQGSKVITSDDIFSSILFSRSKNERLNNEKQAAERDYMQAKYNRVVFRDMDDLDKLKLQNEARSKSMRRFTEERTESLIPLHSNGETVIEYYNRTLAENRLYLLDEPENSLAPYFQKKLCAIIDDMARFCGCQFIIATHSPFFLSMESARIYDLDSVPVCEKSWYELKNMQEYFSLFFNAREDFLRKM